MNTKIYQALVNKIKREGLTDEIKDMLDAFLFGQRITSEQYQELISM